MKILMFGRGVISTQYGWAFENAGHTVHFYVRPGRKASYGSSLSLDILDGRNGIQGKPIKTLWPITMIEDLPLHHDYDLIIVSVQHYHFKDAAAYLSTRAANASILLFNNFWNDPLAEASLLPMNQLAWGFPGAGGGFDTHGVLKGAFLKNVFFGTFGTALTEREKKVRELFTSSNFKITEQNDFRTWLLIHFAMSSGIQLQTLQTKSHLTVPQSAHQWKNVKMNIRELLPVLTARGVDVKKAPDLKILQAPSFLISLMMKLMIKISPSMRMVMTSHSNEEELKSYCRDTLREAKRLNISVPRLEAGKQYFQ